VSPFLCSERDDRVGGGIGETDDPLEFGVLPLHITRQTGLHAGGRACGMEVIASMAGRRAWLPGWQGVGETGHIACTALTNVSLGSRAYHLGDQLQEAGCIDTVCTEYVYRWADITSALCSHFYLFNTGERNTVGPGLLPPHNVAVLCSDIHARSLTARPLIRTTHKTFSYGP
jgi:hypothetical protein